MMYAADEGHVECLQLLIQCGTNIHKRANDGRTAAHCAAHEGRMEPLLALLDAGCKIDAMLAAALQAVPNCNMILYTDSMYVVHGMRKLAAFRASGAEGECHEDLWRQISISARGRTIDVRKVKSHTGVAGNEAADSLAKRGRQCPLGVCS